MGKVLTSIDAMKKSNDIFNEHAVICPSCMRHLHVFDFCPICRDFVCESCIVDTVNEEMCKKCYKKAQQKRRDT